MIKYVTKSPKDTFALGQKIGKQLKRGSVLAIEGPLGAGKTTLVKGIANGLEVKEEGEVVSPTFVLVHEYEGRIKIYHIDWYRLSKVEGQDKLLAEECFDSQGVALIEWADRGKAIIPKERIWVTIKYQGSDSRLIEINGKGALCRDFLDKMSL